MAAVNHLANKRFVHWEILVRGPFFVYIMTNMSRTLYIGVTNDLERRVFEHRSKVAGGFTRRYNITMLAYCEEFDSIRNAIEREKQLKNWNRAKKIVLFERENPEWRDLSAGW